MTQREREDQFITKSKSKFNESFDYSLLIGNFKNQNTKIKLRCIEHDEIFEVFPNNHLKSKGGGCSKCKSNNLANSKRKSGTVIKEGICTSCKRKCDKKTCDECAQKSHERRIIREGLAATCGIKGCVNMIKEGQTYCGRHIEKNVKVKIEISEKIKCNYCNNKAFGEENWCKKHERLWKLDDDKKKGIKHCSNFMRGCNSVLTEDYTKKTCEQCLETDREIDNKKRKVLREKQENDIKENKDMIVCLGCKKSKPSLEFITLTGGDSTKCQACLEKQRIVEENRPKRDRTEQYKEYSSRPEVIKRKEEWKENNYEKCAKYWIDYRAKRIKTEGIDRYLQKNAVAAKKYRDENWTTEYREQVNKQKRLSISDKFTTYERDANLKCRVFELTFEECEKMFLDNCYYCGNETDKNIELNGIDRKNNKVGYTKENTVSSCKMCNMMKGDEHDDITFINICEHILTYLKIIEGSLHPECFRDAVTSPYTEYCKDVVDKRNCLFQLSEMEYYNIKKQDCYLCGKLTTDSHINGIDRILNNVRIYNLENCISCCKTCNYLKRDYSLEDVLDKIISIYSHHINYIDNCDNAYNVSEILSISRESKIFQSTNDVIKQQNDAKKQQNRLRKQKYEETKKKLYGEEKYKQICSLERTIRNHKKKGLDVTEKTTLLSQLKNSKIETIIQTRLTKNEQGKIRQQKRRNNLKEKYGNELYNNIRSLEIAIERAKKSDNVQKANELKDKLDKLKSNYESDYKSKKNIVDAVKII